jgi:hypothetical protein
MYDALRVDPSAPVRAWVIAEPRGLRVVVAGRGRIVERSIPTPLGLDAVTEEQLGQVSANVVDALSRGESIGRPRGAVVSSLAAIPPLASADTAPVEAREPNTSETGAATLHLGVGYDATALRAPIFAHGPSLRLAVLFPGDLRIGVVLSGTYRLPAVLTFDGGVVSLDMWEAALLATAALELPIGTLSVGVGVSMGGYRPEVTPDMPQLAEVVPAKWWLAGAARAELLLEIPVVSGLWVGVLAHGELGLSDLAFTAVRGAERVEIFEPHGLRAGAGLLFGGTWGGP